MHEHHDQHEDHQPDGRAPQVPADLATLRQLIANHAPIRWARAALGLTFTALSSDGSTNQVVLELGEAQAPVHVDELCVNIADATGAGFAVCQVVLGVVGADRQKWGRVTGSALVGPDSSQDQLLRGVRIVEINATISTGQVLHLIDGARQLVILPGERLVLGVTVTSGTARLDVAGFGRVGEQ